MAGWVQATRSAAGVPLAAFAGLLPADVSSDDPLALMRESASALHERAGDRPIVLGIDDAQLLDPTSAALVLHLTVTGAVFPDRHRALGRAVPGRDRLALEGRRRPAARARAARRGEHRAARRDRARRPGRAERRPVGVREQPGQPAVHPRAAARRARERQPHAGPRPLAPAAAAAALGVARRPGGRAHGRARATASAARSSCSRSASRSRCRSWSSSPGPSRSRWRRRTGW